MHERNQCCQVAKLRFENTSIRQVGVVDGDMVRINDFGGSRVENVDDVQVIVIDRIRVAVAVFQANIAGSNVKGSCAANDDRRRSILSNVIVCVYFQ